MRSRVTKISDVLKSNGDLVIRLIIINAVAFLSLALIRFGVQLFAASPITAAFIDQNTLVSRDFMMFITHPWTLIFYPFTHKGFFSLLFNLIMIYWFGNMLSDLLGSRKMMISYLAGSIFSLVFFLVVWNIFVLLNQGLASHLYLYGASAGAFAIMFAYVALNPHSDIMIFTIRMKTRWLVLILLGISVLGSPAQGIADLGGGVFGYLYIKFLRSGINIARFIEAPMDWMGNKFKSGKTKFYDIPKESKGVKTFYHSRLNDEPSQEEIDFLLDKISKGGYESLSKEEKQRLHKASQSAD